MTITPDCREIEALGASYPVIPVCREIFADIVTPITLLRKIGALSRKHFLLESIEGGETWGRYSFLGYDPVLKVSCQDHVVTIRRYDSITGTGQDEVFRSDTPFEVLRELLKEYRSPKIPGLPPFTGGFVGYFAYSMIGYAEPVLSIKKGDCSDFDLMLFDTVIAYDHLKQKISIVVNMKTDRIMENYGAACARLENIARMIGENTPLKQSAVQSRPDFLCNVSKEEYCQMVEKAKEYIVDGDIFQAVLSRQFKSEYHDSLLNAYRVLRTTNPSPYMVYLHMDETEIISTSPETLVRLKDGRLTTFPVAGSRPRGCSEEEDRQLEEELLADEKELSEHNMLVDLGRNDLGKTAKFSTVEVTGYKMIHRFSRIMHICSQVEADIRPDCDGLSAIEAVLPAGTLSGAPKIRACEIIEELEREPRGIYGGALGYIDFTGNMDTCIAIRMAVKKNGTVTVQAGGGIVADSVPELEYEESGNKAKAVIHAIETAGEVND
ncbi:anthranilate synthase component I family protein [Clostridium boliviensis]|uniref:Anthranilate synthase component 1 n=1 Tax=Clostridium boliviensis TaxID=318465 RepID=A0ABU4GKP1_9CLOT|nr:anthranilate synthase component I family protein [Clostridium boliviensis]MDW2798188.1 anthranilate synthase component I family protein [Clostridium boliviensis]